MLHCIEPPKHKENKSEDNCVTDAEQLNISENSATAFIFKTESKYEEATESKHAKARVDECNTLCSTALNLPSTTNMNMKTIV